MQFADGAHWWKRHVQESTKELGLQGGKAPSTSGMKDVVKHLMDVEDKPSKEESKELQRLVGSKLCHSKDDHRNMVEMK